MSVSELSLIESTLFFPLRSKVDEELAIEFLKAFGFARQDIIQTREGAWAQVRVYSSQMADARRLRQDFFKKRIAGISMSQRSLAHKEWADKWKEDYQIQSLGQRFLIVPAWRKKEYQALKEKKRLPIWINPLSAFGSGEHETTRLVVRMLESFKNRIGSFLDIGVGTGILSIVAAHLGAQTILGFDSDRPSVNCAKFNFKENGFKANAGSFKCAELARFAPANPFDMVCANINSRILENHRHQIVRAAKRGGWVLVSGILHQTYDSFREAFDGKDLRCLKVLRGRRWVAILYQKR